MIRLFRKIRQNLLSENRYSLYILYAAGEILLVIVGIIIALQIGKWNESRKENNAELQLYVDLLEDLELENYNIERYIDQVNSYDDLHVQVYDEMRGKAEYDPGQIYNFLLWFHRYNMFLTDKYQESLSALGNDRIHDNLKNYIRQENNTNGSVEEWNEHQLQHVRPYLSSYGINNTDAMFNDQLDEFAPIINTTDLINHAQLERQYKSPEFDQLLFTIRFKTLWMAQNFLWLREVNRELQLILSQELALTKLEGTFDPIEPETIDEFAFNGTSMDEMIDILRQEVDSLVYDFPMRDVNDLGYDLLGEEAYEEALIVFKINTQLYPDSWFVYDSYGESLLESGDTLNAIKFYEKSLELKPGQSAAIELLKKLKN